MTKDFEEPIDEVPGDEGSDATASGPDSQEDSLTVDDILGADGALDRPALALARRRRAPHWWAWIRIRRRRSRSTDYRQPSG